MPIIDQIAKSVQGDAPKIGDYTTYTPYNQLPDNSRYPEYFLGIDNENLYGERQTTSTKWGNAAVKFGATTASTFLEGTVGLVNGAYQAISDGEFTSFYDNDFNRRLAETSDQLENQFASYYTNKEKDAAWYSPDTWATANFWSDTLFKNAGFAVGAYLSGGAWSKVFSTVGKAASLLSKGGSAAANAIEAANAAESANLLTREGVALGRLNTTLDEAASQLASNPAIQYGGLKPYVSNLVRSVTAASGESQIEAYHAKDTYLKHLKEDYLNRTGTEAEGDALKQIEDTASNVGNLTFGLNMALLTGTNLYQFPKIMSRTWNTARAEAANVEREVGRMVVRDAEGNIIQRQGLFGGRVTANLAAGETYGAAGAETWLGEQLARTKVGRAVNVASRVGRTFFSPSEAFEEGSQSVIPVLAQDYFDKGSDTKGDLWGSFKKSVETELKDKDFWVSILTGGLTGGLMENIASPLMGGRFLNSEKERTASITSANKASSALNSNPYTPPSPSQTVNSLKNNVLGSYMQELSRSVNRNQALTEEAQQALLNGDRFHYEDKQSDIYLNYVLPRVQYGRQDLIMQDIQGWRELAAADEGWNQLLEQGHVAETDNREDFVANLDKIESLTQTAIKQFTALTTRYAGTKNGDGSRKYSDNVLMKMAYIGSKIDDYNQQIVGRTSTLAEAGINPLDFLDALSKKVTTENADDTNDEIEQQISSFKDRVEDQLNRPEITQEQRDDIYNQLNELGELTARRNLKVTEYETYRENPNAFDDTAKQDDEYEGDEEVVATPEENIPVKKRFFQSNEGQVFQLNLGRSGVAEGTLTYNNKSNVLALQDQEGNLYEVTAQDFKDGLVNRSNVNTEEEQTLFDEFLNEPDERIEVKRRNTINQITTLQKAKGEQIDRINQRIEDLQTKLNDVTSRIDTAENKEVIQTLLDIRNDANNQLLQLNAERNDVLNQMSVYQDILDNRTNDYQMVLNDIEQLMDDSQDLMKRLEAGKTGIERVLDDIKKAVKFLTGIIKAKSDILIRKQPNSLQAQVVNNLANRFGNAAEMNYDELNRNIDEFNDNTLQPTKAQRDRLKEQLTQITLDLAEVQQMHQARQTVYNEMLQKSLEVQYPLQPDDFISQTEAEAITVVPTDEVETEVEEAPADINTFFKGAVKTLRNLFTSTKGMPDSNKEAWFQRYQKGTKAIMRLPRSQREKLRVIMVTARNEGLLGAEGLIDTMFLRDGNERLPYYKNKSDALSEKDGAIAAVVISEDETGRYFIGEDGRRIGKVGEKIDPKRLVGSKMSTANLSWTNKQQAYVKPETVSATPEEWREQYRAERERILSDISPTPTAYPFSLSRGNAGKVNGEHRVVGNLINRADAATQGIVQIIPPNTIINLSDGNTYTATTKFIMLQTEDTQTPLSSRKFNNQDANALAESIKAYAVHTVSNKGNSEKLAHFIKTMLPYGMKITSSSIQFGRKTGVELSFTDIINNDDSLDKIRSFLLTQDIKIANDLNQPFTEYYTDAGDNLVSRDWTNYQEFLIANDHGQEPRGNEPILTTNMSQDAHNNKYITLKNFLTENSPSITPSPEVITPSTFNDPLAQEIQQGFETMAQGFASGAIIESAKRLSEGKEEVYRNPLAIQAAQANPNYNVIIQEDSSAKVIGVLNPETNEWVGQAPQRGRVESYTSPSQLQGLNVLQVGNNVLVVEPEVKAEYEAQAKEARTLGVKYPSILKDISSSFKGNNILDLRNIDLNRGSIDIVDELNGVTEQDKILRRVGSVKEQFQRLIAKNIGRVKNRDQKIQMSMALLDMEAKQWAKSNRKSTNDFYLQYNVVDLENAQNFSNIADMIKNGTVELIDDQTGEPC